MRKADRKSRVPLTQVMQKNLSDTRQAAEVGGIAAFRYLELENLLPAGNKLTAENTAAWEELRAGGDKDKILEFGQQVESMDMKLKSGFAVREGDLGQEELSQGTDFSSFGPLPANNF